MTAIADIASIASPATFGGLAGTLANPPGLAASAAEKRSFQTALALTIQNVLTSTASTTTADDGDDSGLLGASAADSTLTLRAQLALAGALATSRPSVPQLSTPSSSTTTDQ